MKTTLLAWWLGRPPRDRQILLGGGAVLALLLVFALGVLPLLEAHRALQARLPLLRGSTLQLEAQAVEAEQLRAQTGGTGAGSVPGMPVSAVMIEDSARAAGLRTAMDTFRSAGDKRVEFSMANASFDQVLGWLGQLRRDSGVRVQSLQAEAAGPPGLVRLKVQLVLP